MATARFLPLEETVVAPCPACGAQGHQRLRLVTEKGRTAWDGCERCLALALARRQEETLRRLCREADRETKPGLGARLNS